MTAKELEIELNDLIKNYNNDYLSNMYEESIQNEDEYEFSLSILEDNLKDIFPPKDGIININN